VQPLDHSSFAILDDAANAGNFVQTVHLAQPRLYAEACEIISRQALDVLERGRKSV